MVNIMIGSRKIIKAKGAKRFRNKEKSGKKQPPPEPDATFTYKDVHLVFLDFRSSKIDLADQRNDLESVLRGRYHFSVSKISVPKWKADDYSANIVRLLQQVKNSFGHPGNLLILMFSGHATVVDGELQLASDKEEESTWFEFSAITDSFGPCGADILILLDVFCPALLGHPMRMERFLSSAKEKYLKSSKVVDTRSKTEMLLISNKTVDAITCDNSFLKTLSVLLKDAKDGKKWLNTETLKKSLCNLKEDGQFDALPRLVKDDDKMAINLKPSYSTLHRKYAVKFADELADLIEHEFCVVVVDEEDEELAAMAFMRSEQCLSEAKYRTLQGCHRGWDDKVKCKMKLRYGGAAIDGRATAKRLVEVKRKIICPEEVDDDRLFVLTIPSGMEKASRRIYDENKPIYRNKTLFANKAKKRRADDSDDDDEDHPAKRVHKDGDSSDNEEEVMAEAKTGNVEPTENQPGACTTSAALTAQITPTNGLSSDVHEETTGEEYRKSLPLYSSLFYNGEASSSSFS